MSQSIPIQAPSQVTARYTWRFGVQVSEHGPLIGVLNRETVSLSSLGCPPYVPSETADGKHCIVSNLHGKAIERINIMRDSNGDIVAATFDKSASLGLGKNMSVAETATYFVGENAFGDDLVGGVSGTYEEADLHDLTPNNKCKENGCLTSVDGSEEGRPNNSPVCPIPSSQGDLLYITLSGGGLFVGKTDTEG